MSTDHVDKRMAKCLTLNDTINTLTTTTTTTASTSTTDNQATLPKKQIQHQHQHEITTATQTNNSSDRSSSDGGVNKNNVSVSSNRPFVVMRKLKSTSNSSSCNNGQKSLQKPSIDMANTSKNNQNFTNDSGNPTSPSSLSSSSPTSPPGGDPGSAELRQLKLDCDPQFSRFADYFVICGLDLDTGLEPDRFAGMFYLFNRKIINKIELDMFKFLVKSDSPCSNIFIEVHKVSNNFCSQIYTSSDDKICTNFAASNFI